MPVLAVDFGTRRIGIAVSTSGVLATPHSVIPNEGGLERVIERIAEIGDEIEADLYLVGLPRRSRTGDADPALAPYRDLAERIRQKTRKEVILWDEAYSTAEASSRARERGRRSRAIDMEAAAVILQSWLDESEGAR